jgi:hypothetical protein
METKQVQDGPLAEDVAEQARHFVLATVKDMRQPRHNARVVRSLLDLLVVRPLPRRVLRKKETRPVSVHPHEAQA